MARGHFEGNEWKHCWKAVGTYGNGVPIGKLFKNTLWSAKNGLDCRILHIQSQHFSGGDTPGLPQKHSGAWTLTPISTWLASIPIVPVFQNDCWSIPLWSMSFGQCLDYWRLATPYVIFLFRNNFDQFLIFYVITKKRSQVSWSQRKLWDHMRLVCRMVCLFTHSFCSSH